MRNTPSLLRELPPGSICGRSSSVPRSLPIGQFLRMFNGCDAAADAGCGLLFSSAAHMPFIDELPSAWTGLRRDVNMSNFVVWDKGGSDMLFSLWKDGSFPSPFCLQPLALLLSITPCSSSLFRAGLRVHRNLSHCHVGSSVPACETFCKKGPIVHMAQALRIAQDNCRAAAAGCRLWPSRTLGCAAARTSAVDLRTRFQRPRRGLFSNPRC